MIQVSESKQLRNVMIVSDGTGRTATQALNSALVQFQSIEANTFLRPNIRTEEQIKDVIYEARMLNAVIVHTIVTKNLRKLMLDHSRLNNVETIDIMGPLLAHLALNFSDSPQEKPGIFHELNAAYFRRIEAIEYMLRHDDGQHVSELEKADIVLLGVSRTFKTPLSVYMSHKGWLVANVPMVLNMPIPEDVFKVDPERVFCLNTYAHRLSTLRKVRDTHLGGITGNYSTPEYVEKELKYALRLYQMHEKWSIINVTNKPIEEIASEICSVLKERNLSHSDGEKK